VTPRPNMAALRSYREKPITRCTAEQRVPAPFPNPPSSGRGLRLARLRLCRSANGSTGGGGCRLGRRRSNWLSLRDLLRLRLVNCFLESFDGFSEAFTQLGELTGPEHDEDDDQHQQQFHPAKSEHLRHLVGFDWLEQCKSGNRVNFQVFPITWAGC